MQSLGRLRQELGFCSRATGSPWRVLHREQYNRPFAKVVLVLVGNCWGLEVPGWEQEVEGEGGSLEMERGSWIWGLGSAVLLAAPGNTVPHSLELSGCQVWIRGLVPNKKLRPAHGGLSTCLPNCMGPPDCAGLPGGTGPPGRTVGLGTWRSSSQQTSR